MFLIIGQCTSSVVNEISELQVETLIFVLDSLFLITLRKLKKSQLISLHTRSRFQVLAMLVKFSSTEIAVEFT